MAGTNNPEYPVPMLDTAESIVDTDDCIEPFVLSLFPDASPDQLAMMKLFAIDWFMQGEEMGRLLAEHCATDDIPSEPDPGFEDQEEARNIQEHISVLPTFCRYHNVK